MSELARHLNALVHDTTSPRSLNSVIRQELDTILAARQAGHSYERICQALLAMGVKASPGSVRNAVYRARRSTATEDRAPSIVSPENTSSRADLSSSAHGIHAEAAGAVEQPTGATAPQQKAVPAEPGPPSFVPAETKPTTSFERPAAGASTARSPSPSSVRPGFIRGILDEPCDLDELARQYRARTEEPSLPSGKRPAPFG
jgi:hypothetical protein